MNLATVNYGNDEQLVLLLENGAVLMGTPGLTVLENGDVAHFSITGLLDLENRIF